MMDPEQLIVDYGRNRAKEAAAHIARLRDLRQLHESGYTQVALAKIANVSQPTISDMLRRARVEAPDIRPGTHGGTPYEIAVRRAAGELDRSVALRELADWDYERPAEPNPLPWVNDGAPIVEGSFTMQIGRALADGFLTGEDYDTLLDTLAENG
ncbi:helix-turn-helix domain-containing protein [Prescottella subtropica]|uniref:helix-turn-helix domain-containing protein n=1 Tax=Prescottella subtropica TaxID=2545757 RepID=UPI0010F75313|nr:helix-turn-helix transcriptional regulator [Prescottella subtropica]